jgi:dihydrofolate synthase/folylpolyglutamate synthase
MTALSQLLARDHFGVKLGLDSIRALLSALDHPERRYRVVHVGGTNGKGSVTAMTATALSAAGHRTARYTSPHLTRLEERFVVDEVPLETPALDEAADRVFAAERACLADGTLQFPVTFFELATAIAFEAFARARVDVAVVEVGLGGRFDATNVVRPLACAITNIDLDHTRHLGSTIGEIAYEKAGIIKPGAPVVTGETRAEALDVFEWVCAARGAPLVRAGHGVVLDVRLVDGLTRMVLRTPRHDYGAMVLALRGRHQAHNALIAARLLEEADGAGLAVPPAAVAEGLTRADWPGRLQLVPFEAGRVLLDGAHNPAGIETLAAYLAEAFDARVPIVFGVMNDKDAVAMLRALAGVASAFVMTEAAQPRALGARDLAEAARGLELGVPVEVEANPLHAVTTAMRRSPLVVVAGSLFLVGEVLPQLTGLAAGRPA